MTYTPEQLQAMHNWIALNVMEYRPNLKSYFGNLGFVITKEDFKPDEDANQMLMALDTFEYCRILRRRPDRNWRCALMVDGELYIGEDKSLGLAALVAMCRASGMPE